MRTFCLAVCLAIAAAASAQIVPVPAGDPALQNALTGEWVGVLEYRDYAEPATSNKRVDLPTWLTIAPTGNATAWTYTYDDGPNKILEEKDTVAVDPAAKSWTESSLGKPASVYTMDGYEMLKEGHGVLVLHGAGTDNNEPAETRVTVTLRRNLLEMTEEVRPRGSSEPFVFRHKYCFTRVLRPAATGQRH